MATCTVVVTDYTGGRQGADKDKLEVAINLDITVGELKQKLIDMRPGLDASRVLLYMGKIRMDDSKKVVVYNKSKRARIALELYDIFEIKVKVKTLQHCGSGACVMMPLWAFCCRQTYVLEVPDHETVGFLRRRVCEELGDNENYPLSKIKLGFDRRLLADDLEELRSIGIKDGSTVTLFVKLFYFNTQKAAGDAEEKNGASVPPAPEKQESAQDE
ncbi:putative ubiquitin [Neospora caninum Liverpool]|uniref:Putative ubiquitin n=1 Tax=Neospora caninum (strain Liverpool) TaxID=572307 RepID=F0VQL9_NEOCL|nr:putative ubiquitin [Neospora caninum Liverpool]CBZ56016.1 putative ubiquitin [Neospora caninum Liverpool]CEL70763.1 TPA: ubiquitin, putative [Neospora caninum Liverpool]|eukprot:XP_003886042.1 putative ubiquitin [Neospora caninum Liverpool]